MFSFDDDRAMVEDFIDTQMHHDRTMALRKLRSAILQDECNNLLGQILAYSFFEDEEAAQKLTKHLKFSNKDLIALSGNFEAYEQVLKKEREEDRWMDY